MVLKKGKRMVDNFKKEKNIIDKKLERFEK
jgi:hypothetical protein